MAKRPELDSNEELQADIQNLAIRKSWIMDTYGCSSSYVVDRRKGLGDRKSTAGVYSSEVSTTGVTSGVTPNSASGDTDEITDGPDGKKFNFIRHRPVTLEDARDLIRSTGDNPDAYHISIKTIAYGGDKSSNKISAWPKTGIAAAETYPLAQLYAEARNLRAGNRPVPAKTEHGTRDTVVVISDWQIGKTGRRGGTAELLERLEGARESVETELQKRRPDRVLLLDGGDGLEAFESGGNPMFTNDLSHPDQLDCYATELLKFVRLCNDYAEVEVGIVPSNHAAWRRAKMQLGRPADDYGIFVHKQVARHYPEIEWHYPADYDESLCVDFAGTQIGLVHGHQFAPGKAIDWWQGQAFGDQAISKADVLVTAHYHSFGAGVAGQNPFSGRERMWLGAPTLDSGSDWYRNVKGRDSLPGTMIFDVTPAGFDLSSLTIV